MNNNFVFLLLVALSAAVSAETVSSWQEAADIAGMYVDSATIAGQPLVTDAAVYDPRLRIIHGERNATVHFPVQLSEAEWRRRLSPDEYQVIRREGTERPFSSELNSNKEHGVYYSRATGQPLFSSDDKYDSGTGWPSFTKPITPDAVAYFTDNSLFSRRIEVVDSLSGAHLGHVFNDGPAPTGQRYCMNGEALIFVPDGGQPPELLVPGN